jgi:menaquinol-cytochrome c reductase iron-sulfur subunit
MDARLTSDLSTAGSFEGETVSRRRFMNRTVIAAGVITTAAFTLPALGFAIGPVFDQTETSWQDIGPVDRFTDGTYVPVTIMIEPGVGETGKSLAYIRRHHSSIDGPLKDRYDRIVAISSRCVHVGCPVRFVASASSFVCPCHGGVYDFRGLRVGGPPPRPLDRFYTLISAGRVLVGPRFSVNSELQRFAPRDPGEPLDGIGQLLYPRRLSTPPAPLGAKS